MQKKKEKHKRKGNNLAKLFAQKVSLKYRFIVIFMSKK